MAYQETIYDLGDVVEHEFTFMGNYGAKGEKRAPRTKATPEQMERQNHTNKVKRVRRVILLNFQPWDLWLTMKYPRARAGHRRKSLLTYGNGQGSWAQGTGRRGRS